MVYTKNTWVDDDPSKPLSAGRMNNLESQYDSALDYVATNYIPLMGNSHIGIEKSNPINARIYIGSGTGSLTDAPTMGIKVKIDTDIGTTPHGIQSDVNIVSGVGNGTVIGAIGRVDLNESVSTGPAVGLWGDMLAHTPSARTIWGANLYSQIDPGVSGYSGAMVGAEIGSFNFGDTDNIGGSLSVTNGSTGNTVAFGISISCNPAPPVTVPGQVGRGIRNNILMRSEYGPKDNYVWIGNAPLNAPSGVPMFQIDKNGAVNAGGILGNSVGVYNVQRTSNAVPTLAIGTNSGTEIRMGNGTADTDTYFRRNGANIAAVGPALLIGTGTDNGGGYLQMFEQSSDPAVSDTDSGRMFVRPNPANGAKSQLCVRFQTGATIVIASEA